MPFIRHGAPVIFGQCVPLAMRGFPPGETEIVTGIDIFARVRVTGSGTIREFTVKESDGFWEPGFELEEPLS